MNRRTIIAVLAGLVLLQLVWVEVAGAFSFCFSSGGGGRHRSGMHDRYIPAIGFRPDYWQGYTGTLPAYGWYGAPDATSPAQRQDDRNARQDIRR